jgi:uncharacterized protein with von Willebrand factor type A (vWA) domain
MTDRAGFAVAFAGRLRAVGVPVGLTAVEDFARALTVSPPTTLPQLYWLARITLIRHRSDLDVFETVFTGTVVDPPGPLQGSFAGLNRGAGSASGEAVAGGGGLPWKTLPSSAADLLPDVPVAERLPSALEGLVDTPFEELNARDLERLGVWLSSVVATWPTRRSRRTVVARSGLRVALRPTVARARRTGFEPIQLVRVRPTRRPRRIVMLCDVSQSMQAQALAYFHLMRALAPRGEVFAFATTLTRLTAVLVHRSPRLAIEQATVAVGDRFGGTRIASNIRTLLSSRHSNAVRGAIVVIGSDGWDSDPPDELAAAMARLRRRAWRVIWMNPRVGAPGFEPRVASMAAALPYCDELLPADSFRSLLGVVEAIATLGPTAGGRGGGRRGPAARPTSTGLSSTR